MASSVFFLQEIRESMIRSSSRLVWTDGADIRHDPSYQYYKLF